MVTALRTGPKALGVLWDDKVWIETLCWKNTQHHKGGVRLERVPTSTETQMGDKLDRIQRLRYTHRVGRVFYVHGLAG